MRTNSNTRRRFESGGSDALAVLGASLTELSRGLADQSERSRIRERQDAQDEETRKNNKLRDEDRNEAARLRREADARQHRDDASQQLDQLHGDVGGGTDLDLDQISTAIGLAKEAGRPGALRPVARAPMAPMGAAAAAMGNPVAAGIMGLPIPALQFRRNPTEQKAFDADQAQTRTDAGIDALLPSLPPATQAAVQFARTARRPIPALQPSDMITPDQAAAAEQAKREAAFGDFQRRERFTDGLIRGRKDADADGGGRGAGRVKGDNPKMPRGVLNYVGQLTAKYGDDRAAASKELRQALPSLQQAHPDLDLADLQRQFAAAFPKPEDDGLGLPGASPIRPAQTPAAAPPAGAAPAAATRPAPAAAPTASADPAQVKAAKLALKAAMQSGDPAKVAALRQQLATLTGR